MRRRKTHNRHRTPVRETMSLREEVHELRRANRNLMDRLAEMRERGGPGTRLQGADLQRLKERLAWIACQMPQAARPEERCEQCGGIPDEAIYDMTMRWLGDRSKGST